MKEWKYFFSKRILVVIILSCLMLSLCVTTVYAERKAALFDFQKDRIVKLAKLIDNSNTVYTQEREKDLRSLLISTEKLSGPRKTTITKFGNKSSVNQPNLYNRLGKFYGKRNYGYALITSKNYDRFTQNTFKCLYFDCSSFVSTVYHAALGTSLSYEYGNNLYNAYSTGHFLENASTGTNKKFQIIQCVKRGTNATKLDMSLLQRGDIIICRYSNSNSHHAVLYIGVENGYYSCIDCTSKSKLNVRKFRTADNQHFIDTTKSGGYKEIYVLRLVQEFDGIYVKIDGELYDNNGYKIINMPSHHPSTPDNTYEQ